jgi:hypothetical protein
VPKKITISDTFEPVEVDLLGVDYKTKPITRSVQHQAVELEKASGAVLEDPEASPDKQVEYLAKAVGLRLVPIADDAPAAADHIIELYDADKLTLDQLVDLIDQLGGAEANPTQ